MVLWNGVLWDRRVSGPVHRLDQFTDYGGGGFHPAGNEVGRRRPTDDDSDPDDAEESEDDGDEDDEDRDVDPILGPGLGGDSDSDPDSLMNGDDDDDSVTDLDDDDDDGDFRAKSQIGNSSQGEKGGGPLLEDVLICGLSAKLMRYLRLRVLGDSSQKDTSQPSGGQYVEDVERPVGGDPQVDVGEPPDGLSDAVGLEEGADCDDRWHGRELGRDDSSRRWANPVEREGLVMAP
ncbi:hypothetical protein CRG98_047832 [Punica granatum]|uniref:Uncharacterized protein n=1 Tax=Punica granatum TaxID=22663 RepID=A0A2I0HJB8_PUNGR|nr:hypothetical protein CRG98_047832 [Punica granatum]